MARLHPDGLTPDLDALVLKYNQPSFVDSDPVGIPHRFQHPMDQEVAGFFAAMFSWGLRKTIINKSREFLQLMDNDPFTFIRHHQPKDRLQFRNFKHRTFQFADAEFFLATLQDIYREYPSLEDLWFSEDNDPAHTDFMYHGLIAVHQRFFRQMPTSFRSRKHLSSPATNSTCKRLLMFLRWMVRHDDRGIDLGIWRRIPVHSLLIPLDLHVFNAARYFGLCTRKVADWPAVLEITQHLRKLDPQDPIKYDFALFSYGLNQAAH